MQPVQCLWFIEDRLSDNWRIAVTNWSAFVDSVGVDVLTQFARCFVHADRLTSLIGFAYHSEKEYGRDSVAFERDLQTVVWFAAGTLREFASASTNLRTALKRRSLLIRNAEPWKRLRDLEARWDANRRYRDLRNKVAFHVAADAVEAGIQALRVQERVDMIEGNGSKQQSVSAHLGIVAAVGGAIGGDITKEDGFLADFSEVMRNLSSDLETPTSVIHDLFLDVLQQIGFEPLRMREAVARAVPTP